MDQSKKADALSSSIRVPLSIRRNAVLGWLGAEQLG